MNIIRFITAGLLSLVLSGAFAAVNINTADQKTLEALPGVGPAKAKAIIEYREKNGQYQTVQDLAKVKGISDKYVQQNLDKLSVGKELATAPAAETPAKAPTTVQ